MRISALNINRMFDIKPFDLLKIKKKIKMIKLFKKDSSGKIRYLDIIILGNTVTQTSGVIGTANPVIHTYSCQKKNIGKANETSPEQQAILEAKSKVTEKLKTGYFETIEEAEEKGGKDLVLPMLAKTYKENKINYPFMAQPKLDGMRALAKNVFMSRKGNVINSINHIDIPILDVVLDGELYAHGLTFQENMRLTKKNRGDDSKVIKYHVYDVIMPGNFQERWAWMHENLKNSENIIIVKTVIIKNKEELIKYHEQNIKNGYEGTIIRNMNSMYEQNHRSDGLLKYKDFIDEAYEVINVVPSEKDPNQGIIHCKGVDNSGSEFTFGCGMKFSHAEREKILLNKIKYIGKTAEIRFFEFSEAGIPRFPVCVGFRNDK
jgi:DNA ligase-1